MPFKSEEAAAAYAAGLFEGEGTITGGGKYFRTRAGEKRPRLTPQISMTVAMTDREPLELWQEAIGGLGRIYGPYKQDGCKDHWRLTISSRPAIREICHAMWPYLSPRRRAQIERRIGEVLEHAI